MVVNLVGIYLYVIEIGESIVLVINKDDRWLSIPVSCEPNYCATLVDNSAQLITMCELYHLQPSIFDIHSFSDINLSSRTWF